MNDKPSLIERTRAGDHEAFRVLYEAHVTGKDVVITDQSGTNALENVKGYTIINSPYSTITLKNIDGSVDVETKGGTVDARGVTGNWKSRTEYSRMRLSDLKSKEVLMTNKSNNIDLELLVVPTTVDIRNQYAGVYVTIPQGLSGDISLDAESGKVRTDLPIRIRNRGSSGYAVGKVGSGTGKIIIETKSGENTFS